MVERVSPTTSGASVGWHAAALRAVRRRVAEEPEVRAAVRLLGFPDAPVSEHDIDRRFRALVRDRRPDLGQMPAEDLEAVLAARRLLHHVVDEEAHRARAAARTHAYGAVLDLTDRNPVIDLRI